MTDLTKKTLLNLLSNTLFGAPIEISDDVDWQEVYQESVAQSVAALAYFNLDQSILPENVAKAWEEMTFQIMMSNMQVDSDHAKLHSILSSANIPYVVLKGNASTIGVLAQAVQKLFGDTGTKIIGTCHGEKLYETLMTREERLRSEDMGNYFRVAADSRDLNYDKFFVDGQVQTEADESYTSHNTNLLDVDGTVEKILTTDYVKSQKTHFNR